MIRHLTFSTLDKNLKQKVFISDWRRVHFDLAPGGDRSLLSVILVGADPQAPDLNTLFQIEGGCNVPHLCLEKAALPDVDRLCNTSLKPSRFYC